tara:strand:+ start:228 stop:461 length:234 start_codon:yes stop_codon:yes gene_type:complete
MYVIAEGNSFALVITRVVAASGPTVFARVILVMRSCHLVAIRSPIIAASGWRVRLEILKLKLTFTATTGKIRYEDQS